MYASSWKAVGLVRAAWLRLDVEKGHREELARRTRIPATNLSLMNTGKRPMTPEAARRIVAAVPGLSVLELGAPEEEAGPEDRSILARLAELEAALQSLGPDLEQLGEIPERVRALEQRAQPKKRSGG